MAIKAADVAKLRKMTGAGMMDCKKALTETNGDFDAAIDILRKKGQKIAGKRADREASEGAVIAKVSSCGKKAIIIALNCETDFVAKNDDFVKFATEIAELAVKENVNSVEELTALKFKDGTLADEIINQTGVIGEKVELSYFGKVEGEYTAAYIHPGNKLASVAAFNLVTDEQTGKDVVMQIAAMNPVSLNQDSVPQEVIDKEIEIGKEMAIQEGKPAELAEKIAKGKLNKFFKDNTLLNQQFIKDSKISVQDYLKSVNKDLTVTDFKRYGLDA